MLIQGQVALITGGTCGIGLATAIAFAREGAAVAVVGRSADAVADAARAIRATGGSVIARQADVVDEAVMADVVEEVRDCFGSWTGGVRALPRIRAALVERRITAIACDTSLRAWRARRQVNPAALGHGSPWPVADNPAGIV